MNPTRADGWNHNSHYHDILLAAVPKPCTRALDVGCGLGTFARRLEARIDRVDAIDADGAVIQQARRLSRDNTRIQFIEADFMAWTAAEPYDFISMIAVLHHLPFDDALAKASALLRPGGVLGVIGLHRARTVVHAGARSLLGYPVSAFYRLTRPTARVGAPIRDPAMTLPEIRRGAEARLPGATIQRHVLWRYSMTWVKPAVRPASVAIELRDEQAPSSSSCAPDSSTRAMLA
jgi:2-polyprenyl-3-methyl-5-hydroxy-6-metoxy-1,4-benzoquinol methylase